MVFGYAGDMLPWRFLGATETETKNEKEESSLLERDAQFKPQYIHVSHETSPNKYSLYVGGGTIVPTAFLFYSIVTMRRSSSDL